VGEVTEYWFTAEKLQHQGDNPEEDRLMKYYLYAEYTFWYRLAEGFTAGEAYRMMVKEYYRQSKLAEQVDEETAYYVRFDAENRKFFGDPGFRLIEGVETAIQYSVDARRDPVLKYDAITVSGKVVAKDGTIPKGKIRIAVDGKETDVELAQDGSFAVTLTFAWDKNEERTYEVELIYWGYREGGYLPKYEETQVRVQPTLVPTKIEITEILTERGGPIVTFRVFGRLVDDAEYPVPDREVEVVVGDGELRRAYTRTNRRGEFAAKIEKSYPPLQTKAVVIARFSGDDVYQGSETTKVAEFPPNWDFVKILVAAAAAAALLLALLLAALL
jgi:hypothetical protein